MGVIKIQSGKVSYSAEKNCFRVDGRDIQFSTSHTVLNEETGKSVDFELSHSTGSEWDPSTKWIYRCGEFTLEVGNEDVTKQHAENYLRAKLRN